MTGRDASTMKINDIFQGIADNMLVDFQQIQSQIPHAGERGTQRELALKEFLARHLPKKYALGSGQIINVKNVTSRQCDIVIYDALNCPLLLVKEGYQLFPVEAVFAVIEVKSTLNAKALAECVDNIKSVKSLQDEGQIAGCVFAYRSTYRTKPSILTIAEILQSTNDRVDAHQRIDLLGILDDGVLTLDPGVAGGVGPSMLVWTELTATNLLYFLYRLLQLLEEHHSSIPNLISYATGAEIGSVRVFAQSTLEGLEDWGEP